MAEIEIASFDDYYEYVKKIPYIDSAIFRGESDFNRDLISRIGRRRSTVNEISVFERFKWDSIPFLKYQPKNDWEYLAIAQHHGLETRFLDWTQRPLVGLFFAVENLNPHHLNNDGVVYVIKHYCVYINDFVKDVFNKSPFSVTKEDLENNVLSRVNNKFKTFLYKPPNLSQNIMAQSSVFSFEPDPVKKIDIEERGGDKLKIKGEVKFKLKQYLYNFGIDRKTLFPDLENLCRSLNHQYFDNYDFLKQNNFGSENKEFSISLE